MITVYFTTTAATLFFFCQCTVSACGGYKASRVDLQKCSLNPVIRHHELLFNCRENRRSDERACKCFLCCQRNYINCLTWIFCLVGEIQVSGIPVGRLFVGGSQCCHDFVDLLTFDQASTMEKEINKEAKKNSLT